jgi:DNA-binding NarL/FixJ family response regulator
MLAPVPAWRLASRCPRRRGSAHGCDRGEPDVLDMLSPRERDVLRRMVEGKHGRDIAQDLVISTDTVRTHIRSIFAKLDVHSSLDAVRVAQAAVLNMQGSSA